MVLVVENSVSMGRSIGSDNVSENGSEHCRDNIKSEVLDPCAPCSQFDVVSCFSFLLFASSKVSKMSACASNICIDLKMQFYTKNMFPVFNQFCISGFRMCMKYA